MLIKLNLQRFATSDPSGKPETWVLNETLSLTNEDKQFDVTFTSNSNVSYIGIHRAHFPKLGLNNLSFVKQSSAGSATNDVVVYYVDGNEWVSEAYRTVTFDNPPTGELLTWLQANGTKQGSTPSTSQVSIDLTTLSGWGNVADGQHSIQVVAKADGYKDSEKSTAVSFTKSSGETWLLNDDAYAKSLYANKTYTALFNSNSQTFNSIIINNNPMSGGMFYDSTKVVDPDNSYTFINQAYRTITFAKPPTGDLLTWLQANGVKQ